MSLRTRFGPCFWAWAVCLLLVPKMPCLAFTTTIVTSTKHTPPGNCRSHSISSRSSLRMSNAADLHTGYEWLAREKMDSYCDDNGKELEHEIIWVDIETGQAGKSVEDSNKVTGAEPLSNPIESDDILPLYPLGAVHLPSPGQIHKLNNIEPRNIKMANDLIDPDCGFDGRFCVTLRASDTGRIARTATLMRVVNTTRQESFDKSLIAIRVECVAEGLVEVQQILNPKCWSKEQRIKKSDEYLVAKVRPVEHDKESDGDTVRKEVKVIAEQVANDFEAVRRIYSSKDAVSTNELPDWAINAVQSNLPLLSASEFVHDLWSCADVWQQLTNTIRMARRSELNSDVNEITIDEACKLGGPLKLPVHRTDLPIDVQKRLNSMEEAAAQNFLELGIDPIIDFQIILSLGNSVDRLKYLALLISRERRRLEAKSRLQQVFEVGVEDVGRTMANSNITSSFD